MRSHTYLTFVEAEVAKEGAALPVEYGEEQDGEAARKVQAGAAECGCHGEEHADEPGKPTPTAPPGMDIEQFSNQMTVHNWSPHAFLHSM